MVILLGMLSSEVWDYFKHFTHTVTILCFDNLVI